MMRKAILIAALCAPILAPFAHTGTTKAIASTIGTQEFTCPLDGETFEAQVAFSGTSFGQRFDLKALGPIYQPWPVPVCPTSGFVMYKDGFSPEELSVLKVYIWSNDYQRLRETETPHYMALRIAEKLGTDPWHAIMLNLSATWEAEDTRTARHKDYLVELETRLTAYQADLKPGSDAWLTGTVLLANCKRRLAKFDEAAKLATNLQMAYGADDRDHIRQLVGRFAQIVATKDSTPRGIDEESDDYVLAKMN